MSLNLPKHVYGIIALLLALSYSASARAEMQERLFVTRIWSEREGAPANRINDVLQAADGFLWLATYEGLVRFDGFQYRLINHQVHPALIGGVLSIIESRPGTLWMVTTGGELLRLQEGLFTVWTAADGLPSDQADRMVSDGYGNVVFAGDGNFLTIDKDDVIVAYPTPGLPELRPAAFAIDPHGILWVAPRDGGLWRSGPDGARFIETPRLAAAGHERINAVFPADDESIWLGMEGGVARYVTRTGEFRVQATEVFGRQDRNLRLTRNPSGPRLGGNTLGNLHWFTGDRLERFSMGNLDDPNETVNALTSLSNGGYALATYSRGLILLTPSRFTFYNELNGLDGTLINAIEDAGDSTWLIGHERGVNRFDGTRFIALDYHGQPFKHYTVDIFVDSRQRLWLGTFGQGVFMFDGSDWLQIRRGEGIGSNIIRCFAEDSRGDIWIGTREGLYRWNERVLQSFGTGDGLRSEYILSLHVDASDRIWLGTARGGLNLIVDGAVHLPEAAEIDPLFASRTVFAMHADTDASIWGGMSGGIFRIRGTQVEFFNLFEMMNIDSVFHLIPDACGSLWLTASSGVYRLPKAEFLARLSGRQRVDDLARHFNRSDGLPSDSIRPVSRAHNDRHGRLWLPTENGFAIINPAYIPENPFVPQPYFDSVRVNDESLFQRWAFREQTAKLAAGLRRIEFQYTAPDFQPSLQQTFRIRMVGFDPDWRETPYRVAEYTNLPPGAFRFEVMVRNSDGVWSPQVAGFSFEVAPHFRQTSGFYLLIAIIIIAVAVGFYRRRTWVLHQRQAHLAKLVEQRTAEIRLNQTQLAHQNAQLQTLNLEKNEFLGIAAHDLKTPLAGIEGIATVFQEELDASRFPRWHEYTEDILCSTRRMSELITNLLDINRIEQGQTLLNLLPVALHEFTAALIRRFEPIAEAKGITLINRSQLDLEPRIHCDPSVLTQILDNVVSNAIKFSPPGAEVAVSVELMDGNACFAVSDTGPGIPLHEQPRLFNKFARLSPRPTGGEVSTGLGLSIAKQLTDLLGGSIRCESQPGCGTTFVVTIPVLPAERKNCLAGGA